MPKPPIGDRVLAARVPSYLHEAMERLSADEGLTLSAFIRRLCQRELELHEAGYRIAHQGVTGTASRGNPSPGAEPVPDASGAGHDRLSGAADRVFRDG